MSRIALTSALLVTLSLVSGVSLRAADRDGWISLFDGKSLKGWKASDQPGSFHVEDGVLVVNGPRSHLFYVGKVKNHNFKDFDLKVDIKTTPGSNSGIYFHTKYQDTGWPSIGYECQVNATHSDRKKTGGLYGVRDVVDNAPHKDNEWFTYTIRVQGKKVVLAAADTFRAAAIDQLRVWGERVGAQVIAHQPGADPGAVVYDAIQAGLARGADVLIVDTAGRLHTKYNLMQELKKIRNVAAKRVPQAPHETLLVLDATTGQNALAQAKYFKEAVDVTGIFLAKLDGTAKGGIVFAIARELGIPVRFVGTGEGLEDMAEFDAEEFVAGLLG